MDLAAVQILLFSQGDCSLESDQVHEPALTSLMELNPEATFIPEPEPVFEFDQVREPASLSIPVGVLVEYEGMEWNPPILLRQICVEEYDC